MFSALSSFSPRNAVKHLYQGLINTLDLSSIVEPPQSIVEAARDKAFWLAHYEGVIQELRWLLKKSLSNKSLAQVQERLIACQGIVGRRTLAPEIYEKGIQTLIKALNEKQQKLQAANYIAGLESIRQDFRKALKEQRDFTQDCFVGDFEHCLTQWETKNIDVSDFKSCVSYYGTVMVLADYHDSLCSLVDYLRKDLRFFDVLQTVQGLLDRLSVVEISQSSEDLRDQVLYEEVMVIKPIQDQERMTPPVSSSESSFLSRCWSPVSGMINYVVNHPVQAMTAGLAAQSAVSMAFNQTVSLSSLVSQTGVTLNGVNVGGYSYSGTSVASAGDVNGDGIADMIIGAPGANSLAGASYVVFGRNGTWASSLSLATLNGSNGFNLTGVVASRGSSEGSSGTSVASAGDVNGDGISDLIIGAPGADNTGASYVVFGRAGTWASSLSLATLNGKNGFKLIGVVLASGYNNNCGASVASVGDVNGDGIGDMIIGAPLSNDASASYVVFGRNGTWSSSLNLATLDGSNGFNLTGGVVRGVDMMGKSVAGAGDVNGDGISDLIIGAPWTSTSYVVFGRTGTWASSLSLATLDGSNGFNLTGGAFIGGGSSFSQAGISVAGAGDVNGDGIGDMIIGAPLANNGTGVSYVVFGRNGTWPSSLNLATLDGSNGFNLTGVLMNDYAGISVASAGDVNGDGIGDMIIGAQGVNNRTGASYVVFGCNGPWPSSLSLATLNGSNGFNLTGVFINSYAGSSVASAGDVNGDGISDLIIGVPYVVNNYAGASYVVFGFTVSPTPKISPSATVSVSEAPSSSGTVLPSVSGSESGTGTVSCSSTSSSSASNTVTASSTGSGSNSGTVSHSVSSSETGTQTVSGSASATVSATISGTETASSSATFLVFTTNTPSASGTASQTRQSVTASCSSTHSDTGESSPNNTVVFAAVGGALGLIGLGMTGCFLYKQSCCVLTFFYRNKVTPKKDYLKDYLLTEQQSKHARSLISQRQSGSSVTYLSQPKSDAEDLQDEKAKNALNKFLVGVEKQRRTFVKSIPASQSGLPADIEKPQIFISYAWGKEDDLRFQNLQFFLKIIAQDVKQAGILVWLDLQNLVGHIEEKMRTGIKNSHLILLMGTQLYAQKTSLETESNVKKELQFSLAHVEAFPDCCLMPLVLEGDFNSIFPTILGQKYLMKDLRTCLNLEREAPIVDRRAYIEALTGLEPLGWLPAALGFHRSDYTEARNAFKDNYECSHSILMHELDEIYGRSVRRSCESSRLLSPLVFSRPKSGSGSERSENFVYSHQAQMPTARKLRTCAIV